jgi:hypothetical protein
MYAKRHTTVGALDIYIMIYKTFGTQDTMYIVDVKLSRTLDVKLSRFANMDS